MRKELEIICRWKELADEIEGLERELKVIRNTCKHDVVVITDYCSNTTGHESYYEMKCLFCGMEDTQISGQRVIDVSGERIYGSDKQVFELVRRLFIKCAKEHPEKSLDCLVEMVKFKIVTQDEDFHKVIRQLRIPYVRKN